LCSSGDSNAFKKFETFIDLKETDTKKEFGIKVEFPIYTFYIRDEILLSMNRYLKYLTKIMQSNETNSNSPQLSNLQDKSPKKVLISKLQVSPMEFNLYIIDLTMIIDLVEKKKYKYMLHLLQSLKIVYLKISRFQNTVT